MRERLLGILKCPGCKHNSFSLAPDKRVDLEIKDGTIACKSCKAAYKIEDGIVNFLVGASESAMRERKAMDEEDYITDKDGTKYRITDETTERFKEHFLSMPEGDGTHFFKKGGSFQSIANAAGRFYSAFDRLSITGKETVLEIGACFSYASFKFAEKGCRVVAMDISNYLKVARLFSERAYFERIFCDVHTTPFIDNAFDIVFGSAVLHHSKNLSAVFKEIHRVLKPGGKLVLINESARGIFEKVHPVFEKKQRKGYGDTAYTLLEWKKGAQEGRFKNIRIDFLSIADDYIMRHKNRDSKDSLKLRIASFFKRHKKVDRFLSFLLILPRLFFRPKSWMLICYK